MKSSIKTFVEDKRICKRCIGRIQGTRGMSQLDSSLIKAKSLSDDIISNTVPHEDCEFCEGKIEESIASSNQIIEELAEYEFENFLVGCSVPDHLERKDKLLDKISNSSNSLKFEIRKEIGLRISREFDKPVEFQYPQITIIFDADTLEYELEIRSLYILGKYKKLKRGIPQTKWPCSTCRGKGCNDCNQTGQQYPLTVETAIAPPFLEATKAIDESFHGAGREDIDALMLGSGRPFVLELKSPKIRSIDLKSIQKKVNQSDAVQISDLSYSDKDTIVTLKQTSPNASKTYRALIEIEGTLKAEDIEKINEFGNSTQILEQRTPQRVSHRRADKTRNKKIYSINAKLEDDGYIEVVIAAQGGAYIKEFISGDDGRTSPSISSILGMEATCKELDVIKVDDKGLF